MKIAMLIVLGACMAPAPTSSTPTTPAAAREARPGPEPSKSWVRSLAIGSRVPLVEREHRLMAGYVDDPLKPGVVKFVVIARNGDNFPHSEFRLDDTVARTAHEAAVARFLAPGHWVPMRVGTLTAPTMAGAIKEFRLDDQLTADVSELGNFAFGRAGEVIASPPWYEIMPRLSECSGSRTGESADVMVKTIAYDAETRLVWVVFEAVSELARRCGLRYNVHGFEMWSWSDYSGEYVLNPSKP